MNVCTCFEEQEAHPHHKSRWSYAEDTTNVNGDHVTCLCEYIYIKVTLKKDSLLSSPYQWYWLPDIIITLATVAGHQCQTICWCVNSIEVLCVWIVLIKQQCFDVDSLQSFTFLHNVDGSTCATVIALYLYIFLVNYHNPNNVFKKSKHFRHQWQTHFVCKWITRRTNKISDYIRHSNSTWVWGTYKHSCDV